MLTLTAQAVAAGTALIAGSYRDSSPPRPVRSRWGCAAAGNPGRGPETSGTADPDSSASCSAFCRHRPLLQLLQTGQKDKTIRGRDDYSHCQLIF